MSQFDALMAELQQLGADQEQMTKALPAGDGEDKKIQAAAEEGGLDGEAGGEGAAAAGGDGAAAGADGDDMVKSFKLTLEDGTEIEAQDGTAMVKALGDRITGNEAMMAKALGETLAVVKGQSGLIKSLQDQVAKLSGEGRGRKAVLSVVEKPAPGAGAATLTKSQQGDGVSSEQFFAKAFEAQKLGRISGTDIAIAESCLNRGQPIPQNIVQAVLV